MRRASAHTVAGYARDLHAAADYLAGRGIDDWTRVTPADVRELLAARHRGGDRPASLARLASAVRSFYVWQMREGWPTPTRRPISARPSAARLPETVDVDDLAAMLDVTPADTIEIRDHAMLELFYTAGMRLAEAVGLDVERSGSRAGEARVIGKGNRQRTVPVGSRAAAR